MTEPLRHAAHRGRVVEKVAQHHSREAERLGQDVRENAFVDTDHCGALFTEQLAHQERRQVVECVAGDGVLHVFNERVRHLDSLW